MKELTSHLRDMFALGRATVKDSSLLTQRTGAVNAKGDTTIEMDAKLESVFLEYITREGLPFAVFSEEAGSIPPPENPSHLVTIDPLDGSINYETGAGWLQPYGSIITIFDGLEPKLEDVAAAGFIEYTTNRGFLYADGVTTDLSGTPVHLTDDWEITDKTPVYLEMHRRGYAAFLPLGEKLLVKNQAAMVASASYVLHNSAAAMGGIALKSEEAGAIYALLTGAGGKVTDLEGNEIGRLPVDHSRKYELIGGGQTIVDFMIKELGNKA